MKFNKYFMLGLAGLAFAACSNDENPSDNGKEANKTIIRLAFGKAETKGLGETVVKKYNNINDLIINFYNAQGNYVDVPDTYTDEVSGKTYDNKQSIANAVATLKGGAHEATLEIGGVPSSATEVYIVANQPEATDNEKGIDISSINNAQKSHILLSSQKDCLNSTLTSQRTGVITNGQVNATLTPVASRFELKDLVANPKPADWTGAEIKSFTVKGIYINRFYPWGLLGGGDVANHDQIARGDDKANYTKEKYGAILYNYNGTGEKAYDFSYMCDGNDISATYTYAAATGDEAFIQKATLNATEGGVENWYGYQILPGEAPHLVIELAVMYDDGNAAAQQKYLVVEKYKSGDAGLEKTERGYVYQISTLEFDASNLVDVPYQGTKTVTADISVAAWEAVPITPDYSK